jgi:hypothetical protein
MLLSKTKAHTLSAFPYHHRSQAGLESAPLTSHKGNNCLDTQDSCCILIPVILRDALLGCFLHRIRALLRTAYQSHSKLYGFF